MAALVVVQGCGGDGNRGDDAAAKRTTTSTTQGVADITKLDFGPAVVAAEDLDFIGDEFIVAAHGRTVGTPLRMLCGHDDQEAPVAVAGEYLELHNSEATVAVTTSVHAFASDDEAKAAFAASRAVAEECPPTSAFESQDGTFVVTAIPTIQNAGDEAFSLFTRETGTGAVVADHFVRQHQYVLDVHFAVSGTGAVDAGILATVATEANREFASWADDHTAARPEPGSTDSAPR